MLYSLLYYFLMPLYFIIIFVLKSILSERTIASFFSFLFAWNTFSIPSQPVCVLISEVSLLYAEYSYRWILFFKSIQPFYLFWLANLTHLHLKSLLIGMCILPSCSLIFGCFHSSSFFLSSLSLLWFDGFLWCYI